MHRDHHIFMEALNSKKKVSLTILKNSECKQYGPLFYISGHGQKERACYYVWDCEKGGKSNIAGFAPEKIVSIEMTEEHFEPTSFTLVREEGPSLDSDSTDYSGLGDIDP
jgi:hypothetical protein